MSGRKPHPFVSKYFTRAGKCDNQTNRYIWDCNFCVNTNTVVASGQRLEGRDNRLFNHVKDTVACPNATAEARHEARIILMGKGALAIATPVLSSPSNTDSGNVTENPPPSREVVVAVKKRKLGATLDHFVDHPLTPQQKANADVMFFRCVAMFIVCL